MQWALISRPRTGLVAPVVLRYDASMTAADLVNHIRLDEGGVAWIDGTRCKVVEVAMDHLAHSWSAEEIHRQHPHLSLAQVYAALSFYYDHQAELDAAIISSLERAEQAAAQNADSPGRRRLRTLGLLR